MKVASWTSSALVALLVSAPIFGEEIRGVITRVDPTKGELVVEGRGRGARGLSMVFLIAGDARIQLGREQGSLANLESGQRVRVSYELDNGARIAHAITAHGPLKLPFPIPTDADKPADRPADKPAAPAVSDPNAITGKLLRVALTDREITLLGPGPRGEGEVETTLPVHDEAVITRDGKKVKFEDLKNGDNVVVRAENRGGQRVAMTIQVGAAPASSTAGKPPSNSKIERLRQVLRLADMFLQHMSEEKGDRSP